MRIDKSKFTAEELAQYEALTAKAVVTENDPEPAQKSDPKPDVTPDAAPPQAVTQGEEASAAQKSDPTPGIEEAPAQKSEIPPALTAALERMEQLEKSLELKQLEDFAKKYEPLGEKVNELAATLYGLKKSSQASYDAYVKLLDKNLELVEKSGLFSEIGKSGNHGEGASVVSKIEAAATELQKADPALDRTAAVAKAWENHPELVQEYDAEYGVQ